MMTVEEYNDLGGMRCPRCKSPNIYGYGIEQDGKIIYRDNECRDCGIEWVEHFTVTEIVEN